MNNFPEQYLDLLKDETRAFLYLATSMSDGSPQVTPIWFDYDDQYILVNSAKGRVKDRNMRARPQVALVIQDPANPYRYLQIRGEVVEITEAGAQTHIERLAQKYTGAPWKATPGEIRVTYKIQPKSFGGH